MSGFLSMILNMPSCDGSQHLMQLTVKLIRLTTHAAVVSDDGHVWRHVHLRGAAGHEVRLAHVHDGCVQVLHDVTMNPILLLLCYAHPRCMYASTTNDSKLLLGICECQDGYGHGSVDLFHGR